MARVRGKSQMAKRLRILGMSSYAQYLASPLWERRKMAFYREWSRRPQCFICRKRSDLQLHHKTYHRLGAELHDDLVILCGGCHLEVHKQVKAKACRLEGAHVYVKALRGAGIVKARPTRVIRAKRRRRRRGRLS